MVEHDRRPPVAAGPGRLPREIYVLVGASFLIAIGFGLVAPVLPVFVRSFGVRVALVPLMVVEALGRSGSFGGVALAVFAAGNAAALVVTGRLTDRIGRRPPLLAGLAVAGAATAVLGWVASPLWYLVLSAVAGVGGGMVNPPLNASVADVLGPGVRGGSVLAGFQMAADLGAILGPLIAGALADAFGYGPAFALTGGLMLVALVIWTRTPETLPARAG